jgi:predicted transcriptional regulator
METSIYDFVLSNLRASKGRWPEVARVSKVPLRTLEKIARQEVADPRVSTVQRLADYFRSAQANTHAAADAVAGTTTA